MPNLTDAEYDALFALMQADLLRTWREVFPQMLAHFQMVGALTITVTDTEITVRQPPKPTAYRVQRKRRVH